MHEGKQDDWEDVDEDGQRSSDAVSASGRTSASEGSRVPDLPDDWAQPYIDYAHTAALCAVDHLTDVLRTALSFLSAFLVALKRPLALLLVMYLVVYTVAHTWTLVQRVFSPPLCIIPGMSYTRLCSAVDMAPSTRVQQGKAAFSDLVEIQARAIEDMRDKSAAAPAIAIEMKKSEIAMRDLATLVRHSELTLRERLAETLDELVEDADHTGRALQMLNARVSGAVDTLMAASDYALKVIEAAHAKKPSVFAVALAPFGGSSMDVLRKMFEMTMSEAQVVLNNLVLEASNAAVPLNGLNQKLDTINGIVLRENDTMISNRDAVLSQLWTKLGGNSVPVRGFDQHLRLLTNLSTSREEARICVETTLFVLRDMQGGLMVLRDKVSGGNLVQKPIEQHLGDIRMGLFRLQDGQRNAGRVQNLAMHKFLSGA